MLQASRIPVAMVTVARGSWMIVAGVAHMTVNVLNTCTHIPYQMDENEKLWKCVDSNPAT